MCWWICISKDSIPANITSSPDFVDNCRSCNGGEVTIQTLYVWCGRGYYSAVVYTTCRTKVLMLKLGCWRGYYTVVVYTTCLHQSVDDLAAMSKRLLYRCSIHEYVILPPSYVYTIEERKFTTKDIFTGIYMYWLWRSRSVEEKP